MVKRYRSDYWGEVVVDYERLERERDLLLRMVESAENAHDVMQRTIDGHDTQGFRYLSGAKVKLRISLDNQYRSAQNKKEAVSP